MRGTVLWVVLVGCDAVFDLETIRTPDAPLVVDVMLAGHDEDGDGHDDAIDVCPAEADVEQHDRDGDDVGDACDPNPDRAVDRIAHFDSLRDFAARWSSNGPAIWQQLEDGVRQPDPTDQVVDLALFAGGVIDRPTVSLWIEGVDAPFTEGNAGGFVATSASNSFGVGVACYRVYGAISALRMWMKLDAASSPITLDNTIDPRPAFRVIVQMSSATDPTQPECLGPGSSVTPSPAWTGPRDGRAVLYTYGAAATFTSATIFERTD